MTLFNNSQYLKEAMDSLLNQSYPDFSIVAVDDCSSDETESIMKEYESKDSRIRYFCNEERKGLIHTWRSVFFKAYELHNPGYFAWVSDHDRWHPEWLKNHIRTFSDYPDTALVYPQTVYISNEGVSLPIEAIAFETSNHSDIERFYNVCTNIYQAGNAIYGLFSCSSLLKAGVFRYAILPDRLLLTEISLYGSIRFISEPLWYRRVNLPLKSFSQTIDAQKTKLFNVGQVPILADCPYLWHSISLAHSLFLNNLTDASNDILPKEMLFLLYLQVHIDEIKEEINHLHKILFEKFEKRGLFDESEIKSIEYYTWIKKAIQQVELQKNYLKDELSTALEKNENEINNMRTLLKNRNDEIENLKEAYRFNKKDSEKRLENVMNMQHQLELQKSTHTENVARLVQEKENLGQLLKNRNEEIGKLKEAFRLNQKDSEKRLENIKSLQHQLESQKKEYTEYAARLTQEKASLERLFKNRDAEIGQLREAFRLNQEDSEKRLENIKKLQRQLEFQKTEYAENASRFALEKKTLEQLLKNRDDGIGQLEEECRVNQEDSVMQLELIKKMELLLESHKLAFAENAEILSQEKERFTQIILVHDEEIKRLKDALNKTNIDKNNLLELNERLQYELTRIKLKPIRSAVCFLKNKFVAFYRGNK
jgi:glycosyltransferase involved in cell wall biosynthesis